MLDDNKPQRNHPADGSLNAAAGLEKEPHVPKVIRALGGNLIQPVRAASWKHWIRRHETVFSKLRLSEAEKIRATQLIIRLRPRMYQLWLIDALFLRLIIVGILAAIVYPLISFRYEAFIIEQGLMNEALLVGTVLVTYLVIMFILLAVMLMPWSVTSSSRASSAPIDQPMSGEIRSDPSDPYSDIGYPSAVVFLYLVAWQAIYSLRWNQVDHGAFIVHVFSAALKAVLLLYMIGSILTIISGAWVRLVERLWRANAPDSLLASSISLAVEEALGNWEELGTRTRVMGRLEEAAQALQRGMPRLLLTGDGSTGLWLKE